MVWMLLVLVGDCSTVAEGERARSGLRSVIKGCDSIPDVARVPVINTPRASQTLARPIGPALLLLPLAHPPVNQHSRMLLACPNLVKKPPMRVGQSEKWLHVNQ